MTRSAMVIGALLAALGPLSAAAQAPAPGQSARPAEERFVVVGLMLVDGAPGLAWLVEPRLTQNRAVAVRPGESVGPYQVTRILDDRVELTGPAGVVWVPVLTTGGGSVVASAGPVGPSPEAAPSPLAALPPAEHMEALKQRIEAAAQQQAEAAMAQRALLRQNPNAILAPPDPPAPTAPVTPPAGTPASGPRVSFPPKGSLTDFLKPK